MIVISVVIPVYNSQKFIKRCIDSILDQTFSDFEVICVDDGSTDKTYDILSEYSLLHNNIKVVRQQNLGQGSARNQGVALAKGEYVKFVDADDFLHPQALQILYRTAKETDADIIVCKAFCVNESGEQISPLKIWNNLEGAYSKSDFEGIDFFNHACSPLLWDKLVKTHIAKSCPSPSLRRGQDFVTLIKYLSSSNSVFFIDERLYYYRHHNASVMATPESRETIMSDFTTEQAAIRVMQEYFQNTQAYSYYCQRIKREWTERIHMNKILLLRTDITTIEDFIYKLSFTSQAPLFSLTPSQ